MARIRTLALVAAVALFIPAVAAQRANATTTLNGTTAIDTTHAHPRVATYRNGYGTHFQCTSTCYLIMWTYLAVVAALLALLAVIPVEPPQKPENAPFVLWLGNNDEDDRSILKDKQSKKMRRYGLIDRITMWFQGYDEPVESEDEIESFHDDIDLVTDTVEDAKTFESIGVETDDSLLPTLVVPEPSIVYVKEVVPEVPHEKKPGIFAPVVNRGEETEGVDLGRRGSASPRRHGSIVAGGRGGAARRSTVVGSATSDVPRDELLAEVERRTSMQKRAEQRKEYAKSDIAHDNLHAHELHMYEYLEFVRSLLEGIALKKITQKSGKVVRRTFFITPNLETVYWNQVGNKAWVSKKSSIESTEISHVTKGADGHKQEKQERCLSIVMNDGKRVVIEAKDETMRERLFAGFSRLAVEKKEEKRKREAGELDDEQSHLRMSDADLRESDADLRESDAEAVVVAGELDTAVPEQKRVEESKSEEDDPQQQAEESEQAHDVANQPRDEAVVASEEEKEEGADQEQVV